MPAHAAPLLALVAAICLLRPATARPDTPGWGLVKIAVASFRQDPAHAAQLETQAVMGTPLRILDSSPDAEWLLTLQPDGYRAWVNISSVATLDSLAIAAWRDAPRAAVTTLRETTLWADTLRSTPVCDLVNGCILTIQSPQEGSWITLATPDGRTGKLPADQAQPLRQWAETPPSPARILDIPHSMLGSPYLWGGTSTKMADCSGLTQIAYRHGARLLLPRNASSQALTGLRIDDPALLQPADLLFFINPTTGRVNHTGIYIGDGYMIHDTGMVKRESLDPHSPDFCRKTFSHATRLLTPLFDTSPLRFSHNPWYFND